MTRKEPSASADKPLTLSDADITSRRVTRRSLLGALGVGAGVAAATAFGTAETAHADDKSKKTKKPTSKQPKETDSD